jgi:hypothetical protein
MTSDVRSEPNLPRPPNKPEPFECCNRGCCPCIFDYYWDALTRWEAAVRELGRDPDEVLAELGRVR